MVGVPKSSGCKTCKKRRLKCDESWPECLRCQKIGKPCPGTTSLLTFKDGRPKTAGPSAILGSEGYASTVVLPPRSKSPSKGFQTDLTILDSKWSKSGALSQKWRLKTRQECSSDLAATQHRPNSKSQVSKERAQGGSEDPSLVRITYFPAHSARYELARALVATFEVPDTGYKLTSFGKYLRDIPRFMGESPALDAAAACLANAHSNMLRNQRSSGDQVADPVLYLEALQRLQEALMEPRTGMSIYTLAATTLLGIVETLGGLREDSKYLSHAGGTTKLIEMRGPSNHFDDFALDVLRSQRGKIIISSLWTGGSCFLESEEWQSVAFLNRGLTETDLYHDKVVKHLTLLPRMLRDYRNLHSSSSATLPLDILFRLRELRSSLEILGQELEPRLHNGSIATEAPSRFGNPLVPVCWEFEDVMEAQTYSHYWSLLIIANQLFGEMTGTQDHKTICREAAHNVCKLYECSWAARPLGSFFMVISFSVAFPWVDYALQRWMVKALNELSDSGYAECCWTTEALEYFAGLMTGKREPCVPECS
ncbi:hypothetical protein EV356DRAFT_516814 [Viridothelium virens]|uniref:Zn(2)-C6 fungal-type domain-containing protein n=1 Tax=Viridothelium virens TaxID=1048519 RepID=A0A6A6HLD5_VIRVR|nr:hypothetical protein EV356DRAFT_516814 [Viridothelium virens]